METFRPLSALTAGHFWSWPKVTKSRALHHPALRCASGPLASVPSGPARPTICCANLHLAPSATPKGADAPGPPGTYARPPEVAKLVAATGLALSDDSAMCGGYTGLFAGKPAPTGFVGFAVSAWCQCWLNAGLKSARYLWERACPRRGQNKQHKRKIQTLALPSARAQRFAALDLRARNSRRRRFATSGG